MPHAAGQQPVAAARMSSSLTTSNIVALSGEYVRNFSLFASAWRPCRYCERQVPPGPFWENMSSSTKPEVHIPVWSEDRAAATGNMNRKFCEV